MSKQYLYHITEKKNIRNIMAEGLIPTIGPNSKINNEKTKRIYLSDEQSLCYWQLIVKNPVILKIAADKLQGQITQCNYYAGTDGTDYNEFLYEENIPAAHIEITDINVSLSDKLNKQLCLSHLALIGTACDNIAFYNTYYDCDHYDTYRKAKEARTEALIQCRVLTKILPNLRYKDVSETDMQDHLLLMSRSGFTSLTDRYDIDDNNLRLWHLLNESEAANRDTKRLYKLIQKTFSPNVLMTNTNYWFDN